MFSYIFAFQFLKTEQLEKMRCHLKLFVQIIGYIVINLLLAINFWGYYNYKPNEKLTKIDRNAEKVGNLKKVCDLNLKTNFTINELKSTFRYNYEHPGKLPEIDYKVIFNPANYSKLNKNYHVTKLISEFNCHENHLQLLMIVTSNVSSFKRRETVRLTWGNQKYFNKTYDFRTFFVVGKSYDNDTMKKLRKEMEIYKDIILGDYYEKFYNLPYKFETIFEWAYKHCDFQYLFKTDDDVFINVPNLFKLLKKDYMPKKNVYKGRAQFYPGPSRHGKYAVTLKEYSKPNYPPFVGGGAVIFSHDVIEKLIPHFFKLPFKLDDVYVAMLVANAGVKATHSGLFHTIEPYCKFNVDAIALHFDGRDRKSVTTCTVELFDKLLLQWMLKHP